MKILTVCRYNQARSVTMASAIKHFYPEFQIASAGTLCDLGDQVPLQTLELLKKWDIEPIQKLTRPFHLAVGESEFDLILCADNSIYRDVISYMGSSERVVDITGLTTRSELIPVDPSRASFEQFAEQLSRAIFLAVRSVRRRIVPEGNWNYSLLLSDNAGGILVRKAVLWALARGLTIIDTNWSRPNLEGWERISRDLKVPLHLYNPFAQDPVNQPLPEYINLSRFESDQYEREILSHRWQALINESKSLLLSGFQPIGSYPPTHLALGLMHSDRSCVGFLHQDSQKLNL